MSCKSFATRAFLLATIATCALSSQALAQGYHHGWGNNRGGFGNLVRQDDHISGQEQYIQNRLNQGNLSPQQQQYLQGRMTQLQGEQSQINGRLNTDLGNRQAQLQNELNSGQLNSAQQAAVQSQLNNIQNRENALNSGTNPFYGQQGMGGGWNYGGWGNQNPNSFRGLVGRDDRISGQEQWIKNQLGSGNLSPQQQQQLQQRLSQLQSRQSQINGQLNTDLSNREANMQNMMNSGNLTPQQQSYMQSQMQNMQSQQNSLNSGTNPFYH